MWKSLRSDLTEFVSTVAGDTTEALNRIDDNFPDAETENLNDISNDDKDIDKSGDDDDDDDDLAAEMEECMRRMKIKETFTTPLLLVLPDNDAKEQKPAAAVADGAAEMEGKEAIDDAVGDNDEEKGEATSGDVAEQEDVQDDSDDDEEDTMKAEEKEIRAFLDSFSLDAKTDEIAVLLEAHPDTLKVSFEELVPTGEVTYQDFWQRYFYRCDPERIAAEWAAEDERIEAEHVAARNHAVSLGFTAVTNFLGGAVKAVSSSLAEDDAGVSNPNAAKRRPPFVMSADSGDEDEEEVELGWDDDDDDEEDDDDGAGKQNTIEFDDAATEKLKEQLKTAIEERDLLHQTVEMQTKEISALKVAAAGADSTTTTSSDKGSSSHYDEVKKLKTELFEKDSELAALRASILDTSGVAVEESPLHAALELEVKRLSVQLNESEERAKEAVSFLKNAKQELEKSALQTKQIEVELARAVEEKSKLEASPQSHKVETEAVLAKLQQSDARANRLEKELQKTQEQLSSLMQQQQLAAATVESESSVASPDTQDTVTSAIKVEAPRMVGGEKGSNEEGWGDDDW